MEVVIPMSSRRERILELPKVEIPLSVSSLYNTVKLELIFKGLSYGNLL